MLTAHHVMLQEALAIAFTFQLAQILLQLITPTLPNSLNTTATINRAPDFTRSSTFRKQMISRFWERIPEKENIIQRRIPYVQSVSTRQNIQNN